ncbi:hypothetical protein [Caballeronia sp. HLA56]
MSISMLPMRGPSLLDDAFEQFPDADDQLVTDAVRAWFRPDCDAVRGRKTWQDVLLDAGLSRDGLQCFDLLMGEWSIAARRPLDVRCRCSSELSYDETQLLQVLAHFQSHDIVSARSLLNAWFSSGEIVSLSHIAHCFAMTLFDVGVPLRNRERRVTYLQ